MQNLINNSERLAISKDREYLEIYCDLKAFYTYGDSSSKTMVDFFTETMIRQTRLDITREFVQTYLDNGRCLVLLDALDEVPKEVREELHKKILAFFATQNPFNKVCITSRSRGFVGCDKIEVIKILPLTPKDIEAYIDRMITLGKFKASDKQQFLEQAQILIEKRFLNNFLVLSLLVNIYKAEKALPENKVELYKKCFEYIAKKRERENHKANCNWGLISPIMKESTFTSLADLAAPNNKDIDRDTIEKCLVKQYSKKYSDAAKTEEAIAEFLDFCSSRTELFVLSSTDDNFKFFHRSFFEYFYAKNIYHFENVAEIYQCMEKFDMDSEIYELTLAMIKEEQEVKYQDLVSFIISKSRKELSLTRPKFSAFSILTIGMQVVDDAYFFNEYYLLLVDFSNVLALKMKQHSNQKLVSTWIRKLISDNSMRYNELLKHYGVYSALYVFMELGKISRHLSKIESIKRLTCQYITDSQDENTSNSSYSRDTVNSSFHENPFYMCLFENSEQIKILVDDYASLPFETLVNEKFKNIAERDIRKVQKGYDAYKSMPNEYLKKLLQIFL